MAQIIRFTCRMMIYVTGVARWCWHAVAANSRFVNGVRRRAFDALRILEAGQGFNVRRLAGQHRTRERRSAALKGFLLSAEMLP